MKPVHYKPGMASNLISAGVALFSLATVAMNHVAAAARAPWISDQGDGTYRNPVLFADYSDPDLIRVGEDFYLTASSFNCVPGLPILHSKDLVNWTIIGHAIQRLPERFDTVQHGSGIWAPAIRYHDGWFWIFVGDPDWGILMTKAQDPRGPWTPLHVVQEGKGWIDPCPLWDDDGQAYLVHAWAGSRTGGIKDLLVVNRMSPDGKRLLDAEGKIVVDGREGRLRTVEGPKFYKRNGWYYILAPAGGVKPGWQMAFRARHPLGPYEEKRLLEQGSTDINGPHQGGWIELASGENWFLHFQDRGPYGRVVHLNPVRWLDDWPLMGRDLDGNGVGEPLTEYQKPNVGGTFPVTVPQTSDEFDGGALNLAWQWQANPKPEWWTMTARPGWLRLHAVSRPAVATTNLWLVPNQLLQKFPASAFKATAKLEFSPKDASDTISLVVMGQDYAALTVSKVANALEVKRVACRDAMQARPETVDAKETVPAGPLWLRVSVAADARCTFSYSTDGETFTMLGQPFRAREGRWIGAKVGLVCRGNGGYADLDWFKIE